MRLIIASLFVAASLLGCESGSLDVADAPADVADDPAATIPELETSAQSDAETSDLPNGLPIDQPSGSDLALNENSQWQYNCSLDADQSTKWVWVLKPDNNFYDLSGNVVGQWRWRAGPLEETRIEGEDIVLSDSRGDYGRCVASNGLPPVAQHALQSDYVMFYCNIHGVRDFYILQPDEQLTSQYGIPKGSGSYSRTQHNMLTFNGIGWTVDDQGIMTGSNHHESSPELCTQYNGVPFLQWNPKWSVQ